ncbi:hypothetical protein ALC62_01255, partial [Cyphomyrmex costatus]
YRCIGRFQDKVQWLTTEITTGASSGSRTGELIERVRERERERGGRGRGGEVNVRAIAVCVNKQLKNSSPKERISVKEEEEKLQRRKDRDKTRQVERSSRRSPVTDGSKTRVPWSRLSPTTIVVL